MPRARARERVLGIRIYVYYVSSATAVKQAGRPVVAAVHSSVGGLSCTLSRYIYLAAVV